MPVMGQKTRPDPMPFVMGQKTRPDPMSCVRDPVPRKAGPDPVPDPVPRGAAVEMNLRSKQDCVGFNLIFQPPSTFPRLKHHDSLSGNSKTEGKQEQALIEISASLALIAGKAIFGKSIRMEGK